MGKNYKQYPNYNKQNKGTITDYKQKKDKRNDITSRMTPQKMKYITVYNKTFEVEDTTETFFLAMEINRTVSEMEQDNNQDIVECFDYIKEFLLKCLGEKQYKEFMNLKLNFENTMTFFTELISIIFTDELSEQTIEDVAKKNNLM